MEQMEEEREEMIAEVEVQIERALASMAVDVDVDDSDYGSSRPQSRLSARSAPRSRSRHASDASRARYLRSFATDSTLAETYGEEEEAALQEALSSQRAQAQTADGDEDQTEDASELKKKKRFSASEMDAQQDGMVAVDEGISLKSDKITQKMLDIQEKVGRLALLNASRRRLTRKGTIQLESALAAERAMLSSNGGQESGGEDETVSARTRPPRSKRGPSRASNKKRGRSGTNSSTGTARTATPLAEETNFPPSTYATNSKASVKSRSGRSSFEAASMTPTRETFERGDLRGSDAETARDATATPETIPEEEPSSKVVGDDSLKPIPVVSNNNGNADDSDTDFQSAYSMSPRNSFVQGDVDSESDDLDDLPPTGYLNKRNRVESSATVPSNNIRAMINATS